MKLNNKLLISVFTIIIVLIIGFLLMRNFTSRRVVEQNMEIIDILKERYNYINIYEPELIQKNIGNNFDSLGDFEFYSFKGCFKDTIVNISFYLYLQDSMFRIDKYSKKYSDDHYNYHLLLDYDTIFFYKMDKYESKDKIFIQGEYNYRFMNKVLSNKEIDFYILHRDSLGKIRGDNLPKLLPLDK